jgi:hypothetical protein
MFTSTRFFCHWCWWWHLLAIQKSFALFHIMSYGMMDLTPLLYVSRAMERSFLLMICGLLLAIPAIPAISTIGYVDLPIILLLLRGSLAT